MLRAVWAVFYFIDAASQSSDSIERTLFVCVVRVPGTLRLLTFLCLKLILVSVSLTFSSSFSGGKCTRRSV